MIYHKSVRTSNANCTPLFMMRLLPGACDTACDTGGACAWRCVIFHASPGGSLPTMPQKGGGWVPAKPAKQALQNTDQWSVWPKPPER